MFKKYMLLLMTLAIILPFSYAAEEDNFVDYETIQDGLGPVDKFFLSVRKSDSLTARGVELGCSKYPDDLRSSVTFSSDRSTKPRGLSFNYGDLSEFGLANVYCVKSDGGYDFLGCGGEVEYDQTFDFEAGQKYAIEYYNCPTPEEEEPEEPTNTCDEEELNEFVCKGDNLYEKVRESSCDIDEEYVKSCSYGCDDGSCNDRPEEEEEETEDQNVDPKVTTTCNACQVGLWTEVEQELRPGESCSTFGYHEVTEFPEAFEGDSCTSNGPISYEEKTPGDEQQNEEPQEPGFFEKIWLIITGWFS